MYNGNVIICILTRDWKLLPNRAISINVAVAVVAASCDRALVPNLDDDDGLLHDVVDLGLNEVEQRADAAFRRLLHLDGAASDGAHRLAHKVHVNLRGVPTNTQYITTAHQIQFQNFNKFLVAVYTDREGN